MAEGEKSLTWVIAAVGVLVLALGWGVLAGSWVGAHSTPLSEMSEDERAELDAESLRRRRASSLYTFVRIAVTQIPNMGPVITWHCSNRVWIPVLIVLSEVGVVGGWYVLKRVDRQLNASRDSRRR